MRTPSLSLYVVYQVRTQLNLGTLFKTGYYIHTLTMYGEDCLRHFLNTCYKIKRKEMIPLNSTHSVYYLKVLLPRMSRTQGLTDIPYFETAVNNLYWYTLFIRKQFGDW